MIRRYFTDRALLVTGGTGFLGQALIAKVLADLGDEVRRIYVLIRPRRRNDGQETAPAQRLAQLLETPLFARLRDDAGRWERLRAKVVAVAIDERRADLGLAEADRLRLLDDVDTIFNSAATVVFDEPLDISVQANVAGPLALLGLAQVSSRRVDFVHVSTAYVTGQRTGAVPDEPLPTDRDMRQIIDGAPAGFDPGAEIETCRAFCRQVYEEAARDETTRRLKREILQQYGRTGDRRMTRSRLESLVADRRDKWTARQLVAEGMRRGKERGWTDVYTYTKAMGEQMLALHRGDVPLVIVRPSIIESSLVDPEPGWITGLKVMDPLLAAYGRGMIPDFPAQPDIVIDVIPVDLVVNTCIAAATQARSEQVQVFQVASGSENPVLLREMFDSVRAHFLRMPMRERDGSAPDLPVWRYPSQRTFRWWLHARYLHPLRVREWLSEHVPGLAVSPARRRLLRTLKVRLQRLLYYTDIYGPYTHLDCRFQTGRTRALHEALPADERETFSLDVRRIDWRRYVEDIHLPGMRRHVLRDDIAADAVLPGAPEEPTAEEARLQAEQDIETLPDLLRWTCARRADAVAFEARTATGWTRVTYGELLRAVEARAGAWQALGLGVGDRVILVGDNGTDWVVAYLAAVSLGACVVPIDPQTSTQELLRLAAFTGAAALIADAARLQQVRTADAGAVAHGIDLHAAAKATAAFVEPELDAGAEASVIFTCGMRVEPRGVVLTHRNFIADLLALGEVQRMHADDRLLALLPLHHGLAFTGGLLMSLWAGATTVFPELPWNSRSVLQAIHERAITCLLVVPRILKVLIDRVHRLDGDAGGRQADILRRLRLVVCGGAPLAGDLFDAWHDLGVTVHEGYGLTEAAPIVTVNPPDGVRRGTVGIALPGVEVRIDPGLARAAVEGAAVAETAAGAGEGERGSAGEGEILVRGPTVMAGYLQRRDLTARVLADGWLRTGDLGRLDADGYLTITGRLRDLIVTGAGKNVYPDEVEAAYADVPRVEELAVVGLPSAHTMGEEVHGVAVVADAGDEAREAVRQGAWAVSRDLPTYQRIARLHLWHRPLPRLDDGRVDRPALAAALAQVADAPARTDVDAALAPWERAVCRRVSEVTGLAVAEVMAHADAPLDTFVNSLMAAELAAYLAAAGAGDTSFDRGVTTLRQLLDRFDAGRVPAASPNAAATPGYWAGVLEGGTAAAPRAGGLGLRLWAAALRTGLRVRVEGLAAGRLGEPCVLAVSGTHGVTAAALLAALGPHVDGVCWLVEREADMEPGWTAGQARARMDIVRLDGGAGLEQGLRAAAARLGRRRPLVLCPEGLQGSGGRGVSSGGAFKSGVGLLAFELGVPVIPVYVHGHEGVTVRFGEAVDPQAFRAHLERLSPYEIYREIAAAARSSLHELAWR